MLSQLVLKGTSFYIIRSLIPKPHRFKAGPWAGGGSSLLEADPSFLSRLKAVTAKPIFISFVLCPSKACRRARAVSTWAGWQHFTVFITSRLQTVVGQGSSQVRPYSGRHPALPSGKVLLLHCREPGREVASHLSHLHLAGTSCVSLARTSHMIISPFSPPQG